jgi:hydroxyacylglutathione hydrolase
MDIIQFPMFEDNYGYLLVENVAGPVGHVVAVDPGDATAVMRQVDRIGGKLDQIWITHHHLDHTGGNESLVRRYGCEVWGPAQEADKIPRLSRSLQPGEPFTAFGETVTVLDVGGHTMGHIAYSLPQKRVLFCGDAVFGLGCGRLFEGTAEQMWASLMRIAALDESTLLYCAHEYFMSNAGFALEVDPQNPLLKERIAGAKRTLSEGGATVPMLLSTEKKTNPFFRAACDAFLKAHFPSRSSVEVFTHLRCLRNTWKG